MGNLWIKNCNKEEFLNASSLNGYQTISLVNVSIDRKIRCFENQLSSLQYLKLQSAELNNRKFRLICSSCPNLFELDIVRNKITDYSGLIHLKELKSFLAETSRECSISKDQMFKLKDLKKLKILIMHHPGFAEDDIEEFWKTFKNFKFPALEYFVLCLKPKFIRTVQNYIR